MHLNDVQIDQPELFNALMWNWLDRVTAES